MSASVLSQSARVGVLLIDHGSRREEANQQLEALACRLRDFSRGREFSPLVLAAHMELAAPSVLQGFSSLVVQGATRIIVLPCFLARGQHITQDIPRLLAEAARASGGVPYVLAPPLSEHAGFIELLFEAAWRHGSMSNSV